MCIGARLRERLKLMTDDESVFSRWSRRKRAVVEEESTADPATEILPETIAEPETEEEEAALLEKFGLPVPESLGEGDDFAPFMVEGVPEFLRRRALRVLWRSNPILANLDGLNDYDDDFNAPELNQKVLATGYQVGRGFVKKVAEVLEGEAHQTDEAAEDLPAEAAQSSADSEPLGSNSNALVEPSADAVVDEREPEVAMRPRRMRFET